MLENITMNDDGTFTAIVPPEPQVFKLEDIQAQILNIQSQLNATELDLQTYVDKMNKHMADLNSQLEDLQSIEAQLLQTKAKQDAKPMAKIQ